MLALKTVLAAGDSIPVLIFDEVDANIGGETAMLSASVCGRSLINGRYSASPTCPRRAAAQTHTW